MCLYDSGIRKVASVANLSVVVEVWIYMTNKEIKQFIIENKDEKYKEFSAKLIPGCNNIYGVRIPVLRKLAKQIAKEDSKGYLDNAVDDSFEEIMLQGMVIGYSKLSSEETLAYVTKFIPKINDWSINDSFCNSFTFAKKNQELFWDFLMGYKYSDSEFEQRVVAVMLLSHYINEDYIEKVLSVYDELKHPGYYRMMGVAWGLQAAYVKFPEITHKYLLHNNLDDVTFNKAIQKLIESYKLTNEQKNVLRGLKRV